MPSNLTDPTDPLAALSPDVLAQIKAPRLSMGTPNLQLPSGGDYVYAANNGSAGHSVDTGENSSTWVPDPSYIEYHPPGQGPGENYYVYDANTGQYVSTQKGSGIMSGWQGLLGVLGAGVGFGALGAATGAAGVGAGAGAAAPAAGVVDPATAGVTGFGDAGTMYAGGSAGDAATLGGGGSFSGVGMDSVYAGAGAVPAVPGAPAGGGAAPQGVPPPANPNVPASITGNPTIDNMLGTLTKDPLKLAALGLALKTGTSQPKLPGAAQTALDNANSGTKTATDTINSGGMSSPAWAVQKSSIDSQYDLMLKQETEAIKQNAANSGMGMAGNSMVVQQQINAAQERNMGERQQAYQRALSENLTAAVAELTGGNSVLASIAQMQLSQSRDAQATAAEVAKLAAELGM